MVKELIQTDMHSIHSASDPLLLDGQLIWQGFKQLLPISLFVVVFGVAFGLAATQSGLDNASILIMSGFVFAGSSQFAALELWGAHMALIPLIVTVFAINARHLLMGATLYPWIRHLPAAKRYGIMCLVSDANWAMAMQAFNKGQPGLGLVFGGGIALWLFWLLGTWLGIAFGSAIQDPHSLGLDMVMGCFMLSMVLGGEKSWRILIIWIVAATSSLFAYQFLPENSHVIVGALAGGVLGALWMEQKSEH